MKILVRLSVAMFITFTATACGGPDKMREVAESAPATTAAAAAHTGATASPADDEKIAYHDAATGNDVTMKALRTMIGQIPKQLTCDELLTTGKALGNTYPNGEDFFLQRCREVPRHGLLR